jgi:hypothetical protein
MTERAFASYQHAREHQLLRNDARRIRTRVKEARDNPNDAGGRWPFELLQNACDAGAREGASGISLRLGWEGDVRRTVHFEHDGAPFASQDVAALLSGGSSKDFDSATTTGRFGTGFLVTHVLSQRVNVRGVLHVEDGLEEFELVLDRSGDEEAILASTLATDAALRKAAPVQLERSTPSAQFAWTIDDFATYERGVAALEEALPFIFGTCHSLARVQVRRPDGVHVDWQAATPVERTEEGIRWVTRGLSRRCADAEENQFEVIRVFANAEGRTGALFVVERDEMSGTLRDMPAGLARIFRRFPIRGTGHLPIAMVIDGPFDVDQERRSIALAADDKQLIEAALVAVVSAVRVAFLTNVRCAHRLASVAPVSGASSKEEAEWWFLALKDVADKLAVLPIIATSSGMLPALKIESLALLSQIGTC